ncbi:hypothetical protein J2X72_001185 [Phyllobacterium sp. 1468]|nr:hypothetical protein [Phyllobacterium sp. 1468]
MAIWFLTFAVLVAGLIAIMRVVVQVQKSLIAGDYSWRSFGLLSLAWLAVTIPSIQSSCSNVGCQWGVKFGWLISLFYDLVPVAGLEPTARTLMLVICGYVILTICFLGHALGWILYGIRRLFQRAT